MKMNFTITLEQMAYFTQAVIDRDRMRVELRNAEDSLHRKRMELRKYQEKCESLAKDISSSGEGEKPQTNINKTLADANEGVVEELKPRGAARVANALELIDAMRKTFTAIINKEAK